MSNFGVIGSKEKKFYHFCPCINIARKKNGEKRKKRPRFSVFLALQIYFRVLKMRRFREKKFAMRRIFAGESPAQIGVFSKNISHLRRRFAGENPSHFRKIQLLFIYLKFPTTRVSWDGRVVWGVIKSWSSAEVECCGFNPLWVQ